MVPEALLELGFKRGIAIESFMILVLYYFTCIIKESH
jgi:hypothetical protein